MGDKKQITYLPERPVLVMNQEGHTMLMRVLDLALKNPESGGINALETVNKIVAGNIYIKDPVMIEVIDLINKKL